VRDWIHIEDLAGAIVHAIGHFPMGVPVPIGTGIGTDFFTLAKRIAQAIGYSPRRVANPALAHEFGWRTTITLEEGIRRALQDRCDHDSRVHLVPQMRMR